MSTQAIIRLCVVGIVFVALAILWQFIKNAGEVVMFITLLLGGLIGGIVLFKFLGPLLGDAVGTFFYSSGEQVTIDESMKAAAKLAQGDYEGAIDEYEKMLAEKPDNPFPIAEIAKIYAERLDQPVKALDVIQHHLEGKEWPPDDAAFLMFRMVEIHVDELKDYTIAHDLLEEVIANFPNTRHSANAHHKLHEVEQLQYKEIMEQRQKAGSRNA